MENKKKPDHISAYANAWKMGFYSSKKVHYVKSGVKIFFNAQHLMIELNGKQTSYFLFLCEKMDMKNRVEINATLNKSYIKFISEVTSGKHALEERTLLNYKKKLLELGLLLRDEEMKTIYYVNPKYVFNGTIKERKDLLQELLRKSFDGNVKQTPLINSSIDDFEVNEILRNLVGTEKVDINPGVVDVNEKGECVD